MQPRELFVRSRQAGHFRQELFQNGDGLRLLRGFRSLSQDGRAGDEVIGEVVGLRVGLDQRDGLVPGLTIAGAAGQRQGEFAGRPRVGRLLAVQVAQGRDGFVARPVCSKKVIAAVCTLGSLGAFRTASRNETSAFAKLPSTR